MGEHGLDTVREFFFMTHDERREFVGRDFSAHNGEGRSERSEIALEFCDRLDLERLHVDDVESVVVEEGRNLRFKASSVCGCGEDDGLA